MGDVVFPKSPTRLNASHTPGAESGPSEQFVLLQPCSCTPGIELHWSSARESMVLAASLVQSWQLRISAELPERRLWICHHPNTLFVNFLFLSFFRLGDFSE